MYVHDSKTSAVFNDFGLYVLTNLDRWQGMRSFKQIPTFYNQMADSKPAAEWTSQEFWPEVKNS